MDGYVVSPAPEVAFRIAVPESTDPNVKAIRDGTYPPPLQGLFTALTATTPKPARVLDLGGYLGAFGMAAAAAGYEVAIVEANPENASWIRRSIALNRFTHPVKLVETAVGEREGWVEFHAEGPYGHVQQNGSSGGVRVKQVTLPALMHQLGWESPAFIKMDVEGSEGGVLRGAAQWFAKGHRPVLLYEANGHTLSWFGDSQQGLRRFLVERGYYEYEVENDGQLREPTRFEPRVVVDYLVSARPLSPVAPRRTGWQLLRRTAGALRRNSRPARRHVFRALKDAFTPGTGTPGPGSGDAHEH
jgi:FkbM family methyltransferase